MSFDGNTLVAQLRARAKTLGFESLGIASASARPDLADKLKSALAQGWHAQLHWMEDTADRRGAPTALWPQARSIVMLGTNYGPDQDPMARLDDPALANVSVYAQMRDYHEVI